MSVVFLEKILPLSLKNISLFSYYCIMSTIKLLHLSYRSPTTEIKTVYGDIYRMSDNCKYTCRV